MGVSHRMGRASAKPIHCRGGRRHGVSLRSAHPTALPRFRRRRGQICRWRAVRLPTPGWRSFGGGSVTVQFPFRWSRALRQAPPATAALLWRRGKAPLSSDREPAGRRLAARDGPSDEFAGSHTPTVNSTPRLSGAGDVDDDAEAEGGEGGFDLSHARGVTEVEHAIDLHQMPAQPTGGAVAGFGCLHAGKRVAPSSDGHVV